MRVSLSLDPTAPTIIIGTVKRGFGIEKGTESSSITLLINHSIMLNLLVRAPVSVTVGVNILRSALKLGSRRFSGQAASQPSHGWVPTPYVTESIVSPPTTHVLLQRNDQLGRRLADSSVGSMAFAYQEVAKNNVKDDIFSRLLMVYPIAPRR